jgi:hypothetical protein
MTIEFRPWLAAACLVAAGTVSAADCTYDGVSPEARRQRAVHEASLRAELVTQSLASPRRRAVTPRPAPPIARQNFIDDEIFGALQKANVQPAELTSDAEFLRRISIDLGGRIPTVAEVQSFLADHDSGKRAAAVERLLASDDFVDRWTMWLGDLVQNTQYADSGGKGTSLGSETYYRYLRDAVATNKPYDVLVRELLTGSGDQFVKGAANYYCRQEQDNGPPQDTYDNLAAKSAEHFLGLQTVCLSCHGGLAHLELVNQSLARKTRRDFWATAAFFARTGTTMHIDPVTHISSDVVGESAAGEYQLNTDAGNKVPRIAPPDGPGYVVPAFFLSGEGPRDGESYRAAYARILTAHPQFARATVNYLWKEMFGLGLVEPADSFDLSKSAPPLLDTLATAFRDGGYDLRALLRLMANSSAYQLSARVPAAAWNEEWTPLFARHYPRRMMAEALLDSIDRATGATFRITLQPNHGVVTKAMAVADPWALGYPQTAAYGRFLTDFGQGNRDGVLRRGNVAITQALSLMNHPFITDAVRRSDTSTVGHVLAQSSDPEAIADALYLATLSRHASPDELRAAAGFLRAEPDLGAAAEDLQYALLNTLEFSFN